MQYWCTIDDSRVALGAVALHATATVPTIPCRPPPNYSDDLVPAALVPNTLCVSCCGCPMLQNEMNNPDVTADCITLMVDGAKLVDDSATVHERRLAAASGVRVAVSVSVCVRVGGSE